MCVCVCVYICKSIHLPYGYTNIPIVTVAECTGCFSRKLPHVLCQGFFLLSGDNACRNGIRKFHVLGVIPCLSPQQLN